VRFSRLRYRDSDPPTFALPTNHAFELTAFNRLSIRDHLNPGSNYEGALILTDAKLRIWIDLTREDTIPIEEYFSYR
jgi:hypothetical protein